MKNAPLPKTGDDILAEKLFRTLKGKIALAVAIIDECNDLSEALGMLGYGGSPYSPEIEPELMPYFEIVANSTGWQKVENGDFLDEYLSAGIRKPTQRKRRNAKGGILSITSKCLHDPPCPNGCRVTKVPPT